MPLNINSVKKYLYAFVRIMNNFAMWEHNIFGVSKGRFNLTHGESRPARRKEY